MVTLEKIFSLCKRRGFIFPSSEIYGGFGGIYDFGPLGVEMKNNIKKIWWDEMIKKHENIVGLDAAVLMSAKVWEASGHLTAGFADELVECKGCHKRFRFNEIQDLKCPECGGKFNTPRKFNLMMKTFVGPLENESTLTYLRAETCQGIYVNFNNVLNSMRMKIPFGIAQIGKAFRNEINPKDFIFRTREFEQMEMQWFCHPKNTNRFFNYWKQERIRWYLNLGIKKSEIRLKEIGSNERAHYAKKQVDIEYKFPFGWKEIEGIHNRGDWDLSNHSKHSHQDLRYFDQERKEKYFPHIIETSVGVERSLFAFLCSAYQEVIGGRTQTTKSNKDAEILLRLDKKMSPIKIAILPLVKNKTELVKVAKKIYQKLKLNFIVVYDEVGTIGRRYRRQDEIGTPYAITCDFETLKNDTVTIRDRDTMKQKRANIDNILEEMIQLLK